MKTKELELSIIGNILLDYIPYEYIVNSIKKEFFGHFETRELIETILNVLNKKGKIDVPILLNEIKNRGLSTEKYRAIINEALNICDRHYCYDEHINILKNKYLNDKLKAILKKYFNKSREDVDILTIINMLNKELLDLEKKSDADYLEETKNKFFEFESVLAKRKEDRFDVFTGFNSLDKRLGTNNYGELIIIAGRPGLGKTAFSLNILSNLVSSSNDMVSIFSIEMSFISIIERLVSMNTGIPNYIIQSGKYTVEELVEIKKFVDKISEKILINDKNNVLEDIINIIIRQKLQYNIKNFVIDYLQLLSTEKKGYNKNEEIGYITRSLAIVAKKYDVNIFLLSQLNRNIEHRENKTPTLADLRDSGSIEADANKILFLYCKDKNYDKQDWDIDVLIAKNRNGDIGKLTFTFKRNILKFEEKI